MKFLIRLEFDIEPGEIPGILRPVENLAHGLGCVQIMTYQDSGHCVDVDGQITMSDVYMVRKRERDGEND